MKQKHICFRALLILFGILCVLALAACDKPDRTETNAPETGIPDTGESESSEGQTSGEQNEFTVTYVFGNGDADRTATVLAGGAAVEPADPVRSGYVFEGWFVPGETEPYDFGKALTSDLTLVAHWTTDTSDQTVRVRWKDIEGADYLYDDGVTPRTVKIGSTVRFRLRLSPYYAGDPVVMAGDQVLTTGEDGYYSFVVSEDVTVSVTGREETHNQILGEGTEEKPYLIADASQLKDIADAINDENDDTYNSAYIRLVADIDLNGEELSPIGAKLNVNHFSGTFDGNGHTISNFSLVPEDGYCGFFGYLTQGGVISGLTLDGVTLDIETQDTSYLIGGLVAYNMGGDIENCTFRGSIHVYNASGEDYFQYIGGICGFMQGYSTDTSGTISFCTVEADITIEGTQPVMTTGGIAGAIKGTSASAPAHIYNCVYNGNIKGLCMLSGGIVGYLRADGSVANCYATGSVEARSKDTFATAGGIAGLCENETSVLSCYSDATLTVTGAENTNIIRGDLVGAYYGNAYSDIDTREVFLYHNYYSADGMIVTGEKTYDLSKSEDVLALMGWNPKEWKFMDGVPSPVVDFYTEDSFEITIDFGGETVTRPGLDGEPLSQGVYVPEIYGYFALHWLCSGSGMNTFVSDSGKISYGYFLDPACTKRVPSSMLITQPMTLYVGFADYSAIAGEYHTVLVDQDGVSNEIRLVFDDNGKMTMYWNGTVSNKMYVYDGEKILIKEAYFGVIKYNSVKGTYDLTMDFYAVKENGQMVIYENYFFVRENGTEIRAYQQNDAMGSWYSKDNRTYLFYADGTGEIQGGSQFTYKCINNQVTIEIGGRTLTATISPDKSVMQTADGTTLSVTRYDAFRGDWESHFSEQKKISIDGKGHVTLNGTTENYSVSGGVLCFGSYTATFDENGLLILNDGTHESVMGKAGSYIGTWVETYLDYTLEFYGIGKDGFGYGYDSNGVLFTYTSEVIGDSASIVMYYGTSMYGFGDISVDGNGVELLFLAVYSPTNGMIVDDFNMCYQDKLTGVWNGENGMTLDFNGLGAYDFSHVLPSDGSVWEASGKVSVTVDGVTVPDLKYSYDKKTGAATFIYNGRTYIAQLSGDSMFVTASGTAIRFERPDAFSGFSFAAEDILITCNGKSNVGLGEAQVIVGGIKTVYSYTVTDGVAYLIDVNGTVVFTLTPNAETGWMELRPADGDEVSELGLYCPAGGKVFIGGLGVTLEIAPYFDLNGYATGTLMGDAVVFYLIDEKNIGVYYDGVLYYYLIVQDENNIAFYDASGSLITVFCVPDGFAGIYTAEDGTSLELDGKSTASSYLYASAKMTCIVTEDGETYTDTFSYVYELEDGIIRIYERDRSGEEETRILIYSAYTEARENAVAFTDAEGNTLYLVEE